MILYPFGLVQIFLGRKILKESCSKIPAFVTLTVNRPKSRSESVNRAQFEVISFEFRIEHEKFFACSKQLGICVLRCLDCSQYDMVANFSLLVIVFPYRALPINLAVFPAAMSRVCVRLPFS